MKGRRNKNRIAQRFLIPFAILLTPGPGLQALAPPPKAPNPFYFNFAYSLSHAFFTSNPALPSTLPYSTVVPNNWSIFSVGFGVDVTSMLGFSMTYSQEAPKTKVTGPLSVRVDQTAVTTFMGLLVGVYGKAYLIINAGASVTQTRAIVKDATMPGVELRKVDAAVNPLLGPTLGFALNPHWSLKTFIYYGFTPLSESTTGGLVYGFGFSYRP